MRWLIWLCTLCLLGCAHKSASESAESRATEAGRALSTAEAYDSQLSVGTMIGDAVDAPLRAALSSACADAGLELDSRLSELARAVAQATAGGAPSAALVSFHAQRLGLSDPTPQLWLANASTSAAVLASLKSAVVSAAESDGLTHCGGAAVRGGHGLLVAAAFSRRLIRLGQPIPRRIEVGDSITLAASLADGYDDASLAITSPRGDVQRVALGAGRTLEQSLRFDERGQVSLEILARGPEGVTVAALFVLFVGVAPEDQAPAPDNLPVERDPEALIEALAKLIARERSQRKLPPLSLHAGLLRVAQAHSEDMLAHHFVAHTSPRTGEAQDRVARAGLHSVVLLENIGRGYSAAEIHAGLMESPGHRANILNADVSSLGIGVVAEAEGTRQAFVATELFARLARSTDLKSAARELFTAIAARRKAQKRALPSFDAGLSSAAQAAADAFAGNQADENAALLGASRSVRALPAGARALSVALIQAEELAQVADSAQLLAPELVALGIGVAALPAGSARQLAVVLLLALRR